MRFRNQGTEVHLTEFPTEPATVIDMNRLQRARGVMLGAVTSTINCRDDHLRAVPPSPTDIRVTMNFLVEKEESLKQFDKQISEIVHDE